MSNWRVGTRHQIHVYEGSYPGGRPVATFHEPAEAKRAVICTNLMPDVIHTLMLMEETLRDGGTREKLQGQVDAILGRIVKELEIKRDP